MNYAKCDENEDGEKLICCPNLSCEQKCLGKAPHPNQSRCEKNCKPDKCECRNGGNEKIEVFSKNLCLMNIFIEIVSSLATCFV